METLTSVSDVSWETFREVTQPFYSDYTETQGQLSYFEEVMNELGGKYLYLTEESDQFVPIAGAGILFHNLSVQIYFYYIVPEYLHVDNRLFLNLLTEIGKYLEKFDYDLIKIPFPDPVNFYELQGVIPCCYDGRPDKTGRPVLWFDLERDEFERVYTAY